MAGPVPAQAPRPLTFSDGPWADPPLLSATPRTSICQGPNPGSLEPPVTTNALPLPAERSLLSLYQVHATVASAVLTKLRATSDSCTMKRCFQRGISLGKVVGKTTNIIQARAHLPARGRAVLHQRGLSLLFATLSQPRPSLLLARPNHPNS